jgi:hypothetical protein
MLIFKNPISKTDSIFKNYLKIHDVLTYKIASQFKEKSWSLKS